MKILIVVDMQNDFIRGTLGSADAVAIVDKVKEKIDNFQGRIIYTKDTHLEDYLDTQEGKNLPIKHCILGTDGWKIPNCFIKETEPIIFNKDTFGSIELADFLGFYNRVRKIESIEIIGLCTDICVISNALIIKAFLPEIPIIVDSSCCAGTSSEAHEAALLTMKSCQINVI